MQSIKAVAVLLLVLFAFKLLPKELAYMVILILCLGLIGIVISLVRSKNGKPFKF